MKTEQREVGQTFTTGQFVFGLFAFGEGADTPTSFKSGKFKHFVFPTSKNEKGEKRNKQTKTVID